MKRSRKPVAPVLVQTPFSPALGGLIESYMQGCNSQILGAIEREALHLQLPSGSKFDVQKKMWLLAETK